MDDVRMRLFELRDENYRGFQSKLIPTVDPERVIGVRTPALRSLAKELLKSGRAEGFLAELPHSYFDEDQLHAFIISEIKDFGRCAAETERFLPFIDNWATCDQLTPAVFGKDPERLLSHIRKWLRSGHTYAVRFAVGMLMKHYLDDAFDDEYPALAASACSDEYYINMMVAWYFATALAKQYEAVLPYFEERRLPEWTHRKAIQKAVESRRISEERKNYLRSLRAQSLNEKH